MVVVVLALALVLAATLAWALNPNPGVLPPGSKPYGMSYGKWGAAWWQWELKATIAANPVLDTTGEFAYVNQAGPVFFLAGTFSTTAVRTVTVRAGKALFFPIVNWVLTYPEDVPSDVSQQDAVAWMKTMFSATFDGFTNADLACVVDGVALKNLKMYRAQSPAFSLNLPPDCASVTDWLSLQGVPYQAGPHYPNLSDGYWVMLAPLTPGQHQIRFQAGPPEGRWLDVTYNLTVVGGQ